MWLFIFFFQAEDGIRDLVRSRGSEMCIRDRLLMDLSLNLKAIISQRLIPMKGTKGRVAAIEIMPVSYTHLTLPTSDLV